MPDRFNEFVHQENIRQFQKKLAVETDPEKRRQLEGLLAEELAGKLPLPDAPQQGPPSAADRSSGNPQG